ncbi:MobH family relaxase [Gallibacterium anatis]|uniref:MobH family relaxase n=1 Tax=Gallibacterium anatis TaxID=750 RepID=UPI0038B362C9
MKIINLFFKIPRLKKQNKQILKQSEKQLKLDDGWLQPKTASELLSTPLRQRLLKNIYQSVSMSEAMFNTLYRTPIEKYAELVQELPASESHHHAHLGGMLDHGLEVICFAVKLRQNYLLPPNSAPEDQAQQSEAWTGAVIYSALIHDIAKIITDIEIETLQGRWFPWQGKLDQAYRFKHIKGRDYHLHPTMGAFVSSYLLSPLSLDWLAKYPDAFSSFFYLAAGHYDKAGILGEIIQQADQTSVSLYLGGDTTKAKQPQKSFANQILVALRYLVEHELKLNNPKSGSDGWLTDDALYLVSKTVTDKIRAYLMQNGISVPSQNSKMFDEMQAHRIIESTPDNKAIWNGTIKSDAGWQPKNTFTLLKVSPSLIWNSFNDRPPVFAGTIIIDQPTEAAEITQEQSTNNQAATNHIPTDVTTNTQETSKVLQQEVINSESLTTKEEQSNPQETDSFDFALNLFTDNNQQDKVENEIGNDEVKPHTELTVTAASILSDNTADSEKHNTTTDILSSSNNNKPNETAEHFVEWLRTSLATDKLSINEPEAKIHIVENQLFLVTPAIFKLYCETMFGHNNDKSWLTLQKRFQALNIHKRKQPGNYNIWTCKVAGGYRSSVIKGYLIENIAFFTNKHYFNNMYLTLQDVSDDTEE